MCTKIILIGKKKKATVYCTVQSNSGTLTVISTVTINTLLF